MTFLRVLNKEKYDPLNGGSYFLKELRQDLTAYTKNVTRFCASIQRCDFWKIFSKKVQYFSKNGVYIGESLIQEVTVWNAVIQSVRIPRSSAYDGVWHTPCAQSHSQNSRRKQRRNARVVSMDHSFFYIINANEPGYQYVIPCEGIVRDVIIGYVDIDS